MPPLADMQAAFSKALTDPDQDLPQDVAGAGKRRFDVYRNNRAAGLIDVLAATFPTVRHLVGDAFFRAAARLYIDADPPRSPILLTYGKGFGAFLGHFEPAKSVPYLGDIARLEWARMSAYHAPDENPASIAVLADIAADRLSRITVRCLPSLHLISSSFPVGSIWIAASGAAEAGAVDMKQPEHVAVLRPQLDVECRIVSPAAFTFLDTLAQEHTLESAATAASSVEPAFDLSEHLQGVFALGAIASVAAH